MMKPLALALLAALPLLSSSALADTVTAEADTLVVVTPNAPVVVQQGAAAAPIQAPGVVAAGPSAQVAATAAAAPQNEDWNNVSHINGVPVKVGERGDYLIKYKKTNISGNPFGVFFGYYDVAVSRALSSNLAGSVAISGWDLNDGYTSGYQVSATLPLYFRRTFSGPFLEGGLLLRTDRNEYDAYYAAADYYAMSTSVTTTSWVGPQLMFGWHWTFDSGLNVAMAFGVAKHLASDEDNVGDEDANGYFRVGYAF